MMKVHISTLTARRMLTMLIALPPRKNLPLVVTAQGMQAQTVLPKKSRMRTHMAQMITSTNIPLTAMNKFILFLAVTAVLISSCNRKEEPQEHGHPHDGPGGLEPLAYTLYSQYSEVFVEFKPLVMGSTSKFATHVTVLGEQFSALSEGSVTVSLIIADKGIRHKADKPSTPGIYRLALTPGTAGMGKLVFDIKTKSYTDQLVIDSVRVYPDERTAIAAQPEAGTSSDISYLKEQAWKVEFANEPLTAEPFSDVIYTTGQVQPAPGDEVVVSATFDGIVQLGSRPLATGQAVKSGQTLLSINGKQLTENNLDVQLAKAQTDYERAKAAYERDQQLIAKQLITGREVEASKAEFENTGKVLSSLSSNYKVGGKSISTPTSGFIKNVLVQSGQYVSQGQPLFTITRNRNLVIRADVSQKDLSLVSQIRSASIRIPYSDKTFTGEQLGAKIISYGRSADSQTGYVPVMVQVNNIGELVPGTFVNVWLKTQPTTSALVIKESALIEEQGNFYVYVQTAGESFQKREVKTGKRDGEKVQILSGVQPGERVVTKGGYQIRLSSLSGALPAHGHEH
ncbi:efflux RND transporter periplasmic adaptor subunit [Dyadobacter sp. MSC1_007]|jgi:cobalt-zinc-cadmium efflux system membrane fusion protein|uniref:efflux RND transporter periplasmic adaptor subunit n=1 Tax=Dyadobacter sp. MSC1_007 TaxID=2909264 RepID=UPI00202E13B6|nr:efflux RND transporter periplasmic adaptor subunit [Dyadobacter sp. MSC1_007]